MDPQRFHQMPFQQMKLFWYYLAVLEYTEVRTRVSCQWIARPESMMYVIALGSKYPFHHKAKPCWLQPSLNFIAISALERNNILIPLDSRPNKNPKICLCHFRGDNFSICLRESAHARCEQLSRETVNYQEDFYPHGPYLLFRERAGEL